MPELPEVETVRQGLVPVVEGSVISAAEIRRPDLRWPFPIDMKERLEGQTIQKLRRRAKYILADMSGGETMIIHLGMSGRILISGVMEGDFHYEPSMPQKHDHFILDFENGARIVFNDPRRFGAIDLVETEYAAQHKLLINLGPEPLGNKFDDVHLQAKFKNRKMPVKSALLDQKIVAGLGNIYVCEALHRSGISPLRKAGSISSERIGKLVPVIRNVLTDAIAAGGSSLKDYRKADGELGYFQHAFTVYDREGNACQTAGCKGKIARIVQSGRSTFYCPQCQR
ncbi:MAG: bifunctional DNA-formamidopyrimidine glycosylase/DNA-(apurinic or apyrimidinic site) lyase [Boseongicola sp.]|nr:MAG: bifunctional DNA-formamidopyrimidine glycosylase/DNA-(apurinic or apyrimidinic site) lyase [Boseongicola sp.]